MKHFLVVAAVILAVVVAVSNATDVRKCQTGGARKLTTEEVAVTKCKTGTCKLRRKTEVGVKLRFTPETDIKEMTTNVHARILEVPFPFIGVDGTSACDNIYEADGTTKTNCPLKAGTEYVYINRFPVLELYPKINVVVRWALNSDNKDVTCFELPAQII